MPCTPERCSGEAWRCTPERCSGGAWLMYTGTLFRWSPAHVRRNAVPVKPGCCTPERCSGEAWLLYTGTLFRRSILPEQRSGIHR